MKTLARTVLLTFTMGAFGPCALAQTTTVPTSVNAASVLDAAGPEQRKSLGAIYLIECPGVGAGSGFLLRRGIIVTNSHVVSTCSAQTLIGISTTNHVVKFSRIINDPRRDLALLIPLEALANGLVLASSDRPAPGTPVTTWGYPFLYDGVSPLLSVGYVAGYREVPPEGGNDKAVKHIVVNGAFNHGNSGGPLLIARDNEVIGIVVLTYNFYPPEVREIIDQLSANRNGFQWTITDQNGGNRRDVSESQLTADILDQFYQKTQVMIGEAIGASELTAFIKEHSSELPSTTPPRN
jgi:hypothetical protein